MSYCSRRVNVHRAKRRRHRRVGHGRYLRTTVDRKVPVPATHGNAASRCQPHPYLLVVGSVLSIRSSHLSNVQQLDHPLCEDLNITGPAGRDEISIGRCEGNTWPRFYGELSSRTQRRDDFCLHSCRICSVVVSKTPCGRQPPRRFEVHWQGSDAAVGDNASPSVRVNSSRKHDSTVTDSSDDEIVSERFIDLVADHFALEIGLHSLCVPARKNNRVKRRGIDVCN